MCLTALDDLMTPDLSHPCMHSAVCPSRWSTIHPSGITPSAQAQKYRAITGSSIQSHRPPNTFARTGLSDASPAPPGAASTTSTNRFRRERVPALPRANSTPLQLTAPVAQAGP